MIGAIAGIVADYFLGSVLDQAGNSGYFWAFMIAGTMYLVILGLVHLIMPKMTPLDENLNPINN
jgi:ACS family hexuronate transporter-like MFS transporter